MKSDVIHLLPDSVANQIAAGEVIQRPASVVKELVENSIDAGATSVEIIIKDAGRTLIQVVDNGCGMSPTDARLSFERHATSKILKAEDLYSLHTMGFRGEALPSIAAVSEVEMRTQRTGESMGTQLLITASKVTDQQPTAMVAGTNIMVKRLFFNLPARRKFLKNDATEFNHIMREFERLALVNTDVDLSLTHNDVPVKLLRRATLKQRIIDLFGNQLTHQIIPIECSTSLVHISGFVGLPQNARRRSPWQFFFVNGRNMRHPFFHKAVTQCYEELIAADMQPNYFINIDVDPSTIDVNVHPQKHEVKFENEQSIRQILAAAVKEALGSFNAVPSIDFNRDDAPEIPTFDPQIGGSVDIDVSGDYNPFNEGGNSGSVQTHPGKQSAIDGGRGNNASGYRPSAINRDWQKLYDSFYNGAGSSGGIQRTTPDIPEPDTSSTQTELQMADTSTSSTFLLQGRYIVTPSRQGLMIIDFRRAHILILFHRFSKMAENGRFASQRVMFAETLSLDPTRALVLTSILPMLSTVGFDLQPIGKIPGKWTVAGVPSVLGEGCNSLETLTDIIDHVSDDDTDSKGIARSQIDSIALSMARSAALKRGVSLTTSEMEQIIADLFRLPAPNYTPDGQLVMRVLTLDELHRLFQGN